MASVCFYFQVHQPMRLRHYTVFDRERDYFDDHKNATICRKVANKCYLPANRLMLDLIRRFDGRFNCPCQVIVVYQFGISKYTGLLTEERANRFGMLVDLFEKLIL